MKLHLNSNIVEGTPEELAKYKDLSRKTKEKVDEEGFDAGNYSILSPAAQDPSTDLQVGDRVKVLESLNGAVGEATVTSVSGNFKVELAGKNEKGVYSTNWSNHVSNLEKIEEKPASFGVIQAKAYLEDKSIDQVVEEEQRKYKQESDNASVEEDLYDYYKVVDPDYFATSVEKGTVLKRTSNPYNQFDKNYIKLVTSTGLEQNGRLKDSVIKPITSNSFIAARFKFAKEVGINLSVDTDFEEECKGRYFKVAEDEYIYLTLPLQTS